MVSNHLLIEARIEAIEPRGGNSISELSLPEAILKFSGGGGRPTRAKSDAAIVVMDNCVPAKRHGQAFLDACRNARSKWWEQGTTSADPGG